MYYQLIAQISQVNASVLFPKKTHLLTFVFKKKGIAIHTSTIVTEISGKKVIFENKDGRSEVEAEKLLLSVFHAGKMNYSRHDSQCLSECLPREREITNRQGC